MSNPNKGARLYLKPAERTRKAQWVIRDGAKKVSTGCGPEDRGKAEQALAAYLVDKHEPRRGLRHPADIDVADVIAIYSQYREGVVKRPHELEQRLRALLSFFGERSLAEINGHLCRAYVAHRKSKSAARRELEDLRAAINHHRREGLCSEIIEIVLPGKSLPRERWMTRDEAAKLLWAAWRGGQGKRKHVARFILVGLYTGTRATAICQAAIRPTIGHGYVDLERGVFYRRARGTAETKKRQPPTSLHPRLLAHLRRWERGWIDPENLRGARIKPAFVVEYNGRPLERMAKGFRNAAEDANLQDVTPHILRHTAITWAMQNGADRWEAAGMFGVSMELIEQVYGHHRPDQGATVHKALSRKTNST